MPVNKRHTAAFVPPKKIVIDGAMKVLENAKMRIVMPKNVSAHSVPLIDHNPNKFADKIKQAHSAKPPTALKKAAPKTPAEMRMANTTKPKTETTAKPAQQGTAQPQKQLMQTESEVDLLQSWFDLLTPEQKFNLATIGSEFDPNADEF